jgi:transposase
MVPKLPQISQSAVMRRTDLSLYVSPANRVKLDAIIADRNSSSKAVWRAEIVLATADGLGTNAIMKRTGKSKPCVWRWQERYIEEGVDGLLRDKTRPPGTPPLPDAVKHKVLAKTATETPADATQWSVRTMAAAVGISHTSVQKIWAEAGLKPHLVRTFKISNDPHFEEKVTDVVGLYMSPPDKALVLCVDEKTQVQALDRTQPGLPMKKGRAATMTHDYKRHGVTTLYAAMDVKSGLVIGDCQPRHRAKGFIAFMRKIDRCVKKALDVHVVLDNSSTHKTADVKAWLAKHPRFKLHFTPTSASWLNLVERFFAEITRKRIRRGTFTSVADLEAAIEDYLRRHNANPKPFVWSKPAKVILENERRALDLLDLIKTGYQASESEH